MAGFGAARISGHARSAMARRAITETQLRAVLRAPQAVVAGNRPARQVVQGLVILGEPPQRALLRAVLDLGQEPPEVVTVYATTQFGRYGAKP
jgi:hypothetical protein